MMAISTTLKGAGVCLAIPFKVLQVDREQVEVLDESGAVRWVLTSGVPDIRVDDYIIVHAGIALDRIDETEALEIIDLYAELARLLEETGT